MAEHSADLRVVHNNDESRYEVWSGDTLAGFAEYREQGDRALFTHTEVAPDFGGRGIGTVLAREALDDTVRRGRTIVPLCSFIVDFVRKNPEYGPHVQNGRAPRHD